MDQAEAMNFPARATAVGWVSESTPFPGCETHLVQCSGGFLGPNPQEFREIATKHLYEQVSPWVTLWLSFMTFFSATIHRGANGAATWRRQMRNN